MRREIIVSEDGSHTFYLPDLNEHYHSTFGAIQESKHIFIKYGLQMATKKVLSILEVGFGTGLNAFLTRMAARESKQVVTYTTIEKYPLSIEEVMKLNYATQLKANTKEFISLHQSEWNKMHEIDTDFSLMKIEGDIAQHPFTGAYDLVYFDAFGPDVQPELWTEEIFLRIFKSMNPGARLVTYSVKGLVKRNLRNCGFIVSKAPGPPGKREILVAEKQG